MYARAIYPRHQLLGSRGGGSACYGDESTGKTISEQLRELRLRALATVCTDHYDHNVGAIIYFPGNILIVYTLLSFWQCWYVLFSVTSFKGHVCPVWCKWPCCIEWRFSTVFLFVGQCQPVQSVSVWWNWSILAFCYIYMREEFWLCDFLIMVCQSKQKLSVWGVLALDSCSWHWHLCIFLFMPLSIHESFSDGWIQPKYFVHIQGF